MRALRSIGTWLAVGLLTACGGAGGGGDGGVVFVGPYHLVAAFALDDVGASMSAIFGDAVSDGAGTVTISGSSNEDGTVTTDAPSALGYTLAADGTFVWQDTADFARGALGADNRLGLLARIEPGDAPLVIFVIRDAILPAGNANLFGAYHFIAFTNQSSVISFEGDATFDGAGNGQLLAGATQNAEGTISAVLPAVPFTYTVSPDGSLDLGGAAPETRHLGGIVEGGDLALISGATASSGTPALYAFLRAAVTANDATLSGTYAVVGIGYDASTPSFRSVTGTVVADGLGGLTVTTTSHEDGVVTNDPPEAVTYSVAADGTLTVTTPGGTLEGAVSQNGLFAIVGGGVTAGTEPLFYVLVRLD